MEKEKAIICPDYPPNWIGWRSGTKTLWNSSRCEFCQRAKFNIAAALLPSTDLPQGRSHPGSSCYASNGAFLPHFFLYFLAPSSRFPSVRSASLQFRVPSSSFADKTPLSETGNWEQSVQPDRTGGKLAMEEFSGSVAGPNSIHFLTASFLERLLH